MPHRIEVALKEGIADPRGESVKKRAWNELGIRLDDVRTIKVFTLNFGPPKETLELIAGELFRDKVIELYSIDRPIASDFDFLVEKGFRPGVTDNVGKTARRQLQYVIGRKLGFDEKVFSSVQFLFKGRSLTRQDVGLIARRLLGNGLIESFSCFSKEEWNPQRGVGYPMPVVRQDHIIKVETFDVGTYSDEQLNRLSKERCLALSSEELHAIKDHFIIPDVLSLRRRADISPEPTDVELEALAQTWSEHCKHKEFNASVTYFDTHTGEKEVIHSLFRTYIQGATRVIRERLRKIGRDYLIKVFNDNAGIVRYNEETGFVFKVETHNSPSALDPYGGAITGIVGVNRDPAGTGMAGARCFFNTDVFCFGNPFYRGKLPPNTLHPMQIFEGVHRGVCDGGNQSGIPTLNGSLYFDDRYMGKPLVYCGTGALMPLLVNGRKAHKKVVRPGYLVLMAGGRVGKDGIHGVTMASEERHEGTPVTAVQIGDPITQKILLDYIAELRQRGLLSAITDNGGGGLSSSVGELARLSNGVRLDLKNVPLKYHGLQPWEIFVSESQERMTLVIRPEMLDEVMGLAEEREVEVSCIGEFTDAGFLEVTYGDMKVAHLSMGFLHDGLPKKHIEAVWAQPVHEGPDVPEPESVLQELKCLLATLNICSKEHIVRAYDHEVKGCTIIKPLCGRKNDGPSDAAVIAPEIGFYEGLIIGHGICPRYSDIDAYHMSACAFDEMARNIVATGGSIPDLEHGHTPMWSVNDNFCCPDSLYDPTSNPDGKLKFAQLVRATKALYDISTHYNIPLTSGKDSMKNDFTYADENGRRVKISIPLTLLYSGVCKVDDIRKCVTIDAKSEGDIVYVLGETKNELGGSEYFLHKGFTGNSVPEVDFESAVQLYRAVSNAMQLCLIESCHDCSQGGLGVTLAESAFSGCLGMEIDARKIPRKGIKRNDFLLFSESQSRFVVTVKPENQEQFEQVMEGTVFSEVGRVIKEKVFRITRLDRSREAIPLEELKTAWQKPLRFDLLLEGVE